jgi:4-carboxymuconolactone decarboxylase
MTDSSLRAKGRAMRRNLMGAAYADKLDQQLYTDPIMEKFAALTQETVFGTLWTRPGLDLKTRTLICVVSDTATGRTPELKLHIRFACNHGWTEDKLVEAILHLLGYVGAPLVREALLVAKETFAEMRAEIRSRHNSELIRSPSNAEREPLGVSGIRPARGGLDGCHDCKFGHDVHPLSLPRIVREPNSAVRDYQIGSSRSGTSL